VNAIPLTRPANKEPKEKDRFYRILDAAFADRDKAVRLIKEDRTILDARNGISDTALHFFVEENEKDSVAWRRDQGGDIKTRNDFGATPLIEGVRLGDLELCR
jgi:hypothetical protein